MKRTDIIENLIAQGFKAEAENSIKNGVIFEEIRIDTGAQITPIIYTEQIIREAEEEGKSLDDVTLQVIKIYEEHKTTGIDVSEIFEKDFILSHIYIGVQKESSQYLEKGNCDFEDIESYLYVRGEDGVENYSIKVSPTYLEKAGISSQDAWERAEENTLEETQIESMAKVMAEMMGMDYDPSMDEDMPMYVLTNRKKMHGASAIYDHDALFNFAQEHNTIKLVVIPSSIHECIVIPYKDGMDIEEFSSMVREVNETQVLEEERLADRAFMMEF